MPYSINRAVLEREVVIETYRSGGPGGQHKNVTDSAVRLTHLPSGVAVVSADSRSQHRNKEVAFDRLIRRLTLLNRARKRRVPTRKTSAAKERTLVEKKQRQKTKQLRRRLSPNDEC